MKPLEASPAEPSRDGALPVDLESLRIDRGQGGRRVRKGPSFLRRLLGILLLLAIGAAGSWIYLTRFHAGGGLATGPARKAITAARVRLVDPAARNRAAGFSAAGWVKLPRYHPVMVTPLVGGRLEDVLVIEGDRVEEGQVLATIYAEDFRAELQAAEALVRAACAECEKMEAGYRTQEVEEAQAEIARLEAELEQAQVELERSKKLAPSGAIPLEQVQRDETRVETLEANLQKGRSKVALLEEGFRKEDIQLALARRAKAEADRDLAKLKLSYASIRSPIHGVVLERFGHRGQWVKPEDGVVVSLFDPADLEARVDVNQDDLPKVFVGQSVEVTSRAEPKRKYVGKVFLIEPKADLVKNTVSVRAKLEPVEGHLLFPDMVVAVRFLPRGKEGDAATGGQKAKPIVVVPEVAVLKSGEETVVFVLEGNKAVRRRVALGDLSDGTFHVLSGLAGGEIVVVKGHLGLVDGDEVDVAE